MSKTEIITENDTKDAEKSNISEQTSPNTTLHLHVDEAEEKDVRRSVLHTEEEFEAKRNKLDPNFKTSMPNKETGFFGKHQEYIICYDYGRQGQNYEGAYQPSALGQYPPPGQYPTPDQYSLQSSNAQQGSYGPQDQQNQAQQDYAPTLDYNEQDKEERNAFVRKVTIIVFIMLLITAALVGTVLAVDVLRLFFQRFRLYFLIASIIGLFIMSCVMPSSTCARVYPTNYMCLGLALILKSTLCATITCMYKTHILWQALLVTAAVVAVCVLLACSSFDFTKFILYVIAISVALSVVGIIILVTKLAFGLSWKPLNIAVLIVSSLLLVVSLIIDLQMILGGKAVELSVYDYALGAYMLYTSIIDVFLKSARLLRLAE